MFVSLPSLTPILPGTRERRREGRRDGVTRGTYTRKPKRKVPHPSLPPSLFPHTHTYPPIRLILRDTRIPATGPAIQATIAAAGVVLEGTVRVSEHLTLLHCGLLGIGRVPERGQGARRALVGAGIVSIVDALVRRGVHPGGIGQDLGGAFEVGHVGVRPHVVGGRRAIVAAQGEVALGSVFHQGVALGGLGPCAVARHGSVLVLLCILALGGDGGAVGLHAPGTGACA